MNRPEITGSGVTVKAEDLIALRAHLAPGAEQSITASALPGGFAVARRGNGQVIADSRLYINGDDLRHIDRGATARTGDLHVRTFHEERDKVTFLVADFRPSMLWGMRHALRSVTAAHALAWLGWQAVEAGGRVGLLAITADERFLVSSRPRVSGMLAVIGGLVRSHAHAISGSIETTMDPELSDMLSGLDRLVPRGAEVVIASALDYRGAEFAATLGGLSRHRSARFLMIEEQALKDLPAGTYPLRRSDGTKSHAIFRKGATTAGPDNRELEGYQIDYIDTGRPVQGSGGA
ncbi:MAG: DUF58 domain-containing protein [Paracoccaceae bacterium]